MLTKLKNIFRQQISKNKISVQSHIQGLKPIDQSVYLNPINRGINQEQIFLGTLHNDSIGFQQNFTFNVMTAIGGMIIQIKEFDTEQNKMKEKLYLIPDGDNVPKQIGDIVCMEMLRRV
jgi:hypothetical protein